MHRFYERFMNSFPHVHKSSSWQPNRRVGRRGERRGVARSSGLEVEVGVELELVLELELEQSSDSSEQERKRRKKEKQKEEKRRKKQQKKEEPRKKKGVAGGRGMEEEEPATDVEEVEAEMEGVTVEHAWGGAGGQGVLLVTPWLTGEAGHAWSLSHANQRNVLTLPSVRGQWVLARCSPFFEPRGDIHHPALGIMPPFTAPHPKQGCRGGLAAHRGGMAMETPAGKTPVPHPWYTR